MAAILFRAFSRTTCGWAWGAFPTQPAVNLFQKRFASSSSDGNSRFGRDVHQQGSQKVTSVVLPLGSQKVYVPSERMAQAWREKMARIQEFLKLSPKDRELRLFGVSLDKFYGEHQVSAPELRTRKDLERVQVFVNERVKAAGLTPVSIRAQDGSGGENVFESVTATINKFFALRDFNASIRVQSVTEYYWNVEVKEDYLFPFSHVREDLHAMIQMGLPYLDQSTVYHDVGSGLGEGLIEVLNESFSKDRVPGSIVGTDINPYALEATKLLVEEEFGGIDNIYLRYANAADSLSDVPLRFTPKLVVVGANRFFSILDPRVFKSVIRGFSQQMQGSGVLLSGITTDSPRNLQTVRQFVLNRHPDRYELVESEYGFILFLKNPFQEYLKREGISEQELVDSIHRTTELPKEDIDVSRVIRQVYYNREAFVKKIEEEGFQATELREVLQPMHDEREVILFEKTKS